MTPVALLEEVRIGGAAIRRASLHSAGHLEALALTEGCQVRVRRSGDIIPQVGARAQWFLSLACAIVAGSLRSACSSSPSGGAFEPSAG